MLASTVLLSFLLLFPLELHAADQFGEDRVATASLESTPNYDYRLGTNDVIKLQVFGENDLTTETRVSGEGKIAFPLLGVLEVKGLTIKETENLIANRLKSEGYLKNPRVNVYITKYRNFYVSGEVKHPGGYPYEEGLTVTKAAMLAGGFTDKASKDRIKVKRQSGKQEQNRPINLEDQVLPDDVIVVPDDDIIIPRSQVK